MNMMNAFVLAVGMIVGLGISIASLFNFELLFQLTLPRWLDRLFGRKLARVLVILLAALFMMFIAIKIPLYGGKN